MKPPERIETERLILRKPRSDDAPALFAAYAQDPEVTRYLTWRPHQRVEESYKTIEGCIKSWEEERDYPYVITVKNLDSPIGMIALHPERFKIGLGYVLARAYWGRGFMTEAVRSVVSLAVHQPDIYRVFAVCDIDNLASARVMEKVGMQREGLLKKYIVHPNVGEEPRDCYLYAIVK